MFKYATTLLALTAIALATTACGAGGDVSAKSDETVCVYDGSNRGSQKLKFQIFPGQEPRDKDNNDEVVRIPVSNRFYAAFADRSIADAGAPTHYLGYAKGNTAVHVQGSYKFRFNVDRACEWYAKHGRRNAGENGLGFNARSDEAASNLSPWVRWLNENFGVVGGQTVKSETDPFTWPELVYGNDAQAPNRSEPVDIAYGKHIGRHFTERLTRSLGGQFFCGTDVSVWGEDENVNTDCPPIFFEVGPIEPRKAELVTNRELLETTRTQLETQALQAKARSDRLASQIKDEQTKQALLREQQETARLEVLASAEYHRCTAYAKLGLDCKGNRFPTYVIGGAATP